eukprot:TRINITY_DN3900_c1_g1_i1.p1 TRINITY_DN3900_c1_g1~~TRINITY_DN3900_c1_g1_i1.p1  ORF type:complete len:151 (+),score=20.34 TRINITY_DN3900_c1_g1_i1:796-1248(+)
MNHEFTVIVDFRERAMHKVLERVMAWSNTLEMKNLALGDVVWKNSHKKIVEIILERKHVKDLELCVANQKLWEQLNRLSDTKLKIIVVVEGNPDQVTKISKKWLQSTFEKMRGNGIRILFSKNVYETCVEVKWITHELEMDFQLDKWPLV